MTRISTSLITLFIAVALMGQSLKAQKAPGGGDAYGLAAVPANAAQLWDKVVEDVHFESLPMSEIVRYLREEFLGLNFVLADELRSVAPNLQLKRVTISDILEGLSLATDNLVQYEMVSERLVHLRVDPGVRMKPQLRAFNLRNYFEAFGGEEEEALKELYQVLEQGWTMMRHAGGSQTQGRRPELSIHQKTKLLIAVGYETELRVVESIVEALHGTRSRVRGGMGMSTMGGGFGGYGGGGYGIGDSAGGGFGSSYGGYGGGGGGGGTTGIGGAYGAAGGGAGLGAGAGAGVGPADSSAGGTRKKK